MSPTPRTAFALALLALSALIIPPEAAALGMVAVLTVAVVDALAVRRAPEVNRLLSPALVRGARNDLRLKVARPLRGAVRLRQPLPPDFTLEPSEQDEQLEGRLVANRRGRYAFPPAASRSTGPLGLGRWYHRPGAEAEVLVFPDLPGGRRLAHAVRRGRFREEGRRTRGPLGLGTEFESVRDYSPDDDVRQVNWRATARLGRPMSNQFRIERDRDVICLVDCGRLMAAPLGNRTRLDAALDVVVAVAAVAEEVGDRCGVLAFDGEIRRFLTPRRKATERIVHAIFDLEPVEVESDYTLAFQKVGDAKRAFVLVLTDLLEEEAARPLVEALPVLARRHAVTVATAADEDLDAFVQIEPEQAIQVYRAVVALDVLQGRSRAESALRRAGAQVVDVPADRLPSACVSAYLRAKARARL